MKKQRLKKILAIVLSLALAFGTITLMPKSANKIQAAPVSTDQVKNINFGTVGIDNPISTTSSATAWEGSKVIYAGKECYVLDKDGNLTGGNSSVDGNMLLLTKNTLAPQQAFDSSRSDWSTSQIRSNVNSISLDEADGGFLKTMSKVEAECLTPLLISTSNTTSGGYSGYPRNTNSDAIFFLDITDIKNANYGFGSNNAKASDANWWLRSAGSKYNYAAAVLNMGTFAIVSSTGYDITNANNKLNIRPAFNVKCDNVFLTTSKNTCKSVFGMVGSDDVSDNTWKLTLKDGNTGFSATRTDDGYLLAGTTVEITVNSLGTAGTDVEYNAISAVLTDVDGSVICYGHANEEFGTGVGNYTFTIPAGVTGAAELYVFAEEANQTTADAVATDYASNAIDFSGEIPEEMQHLISFDANGGEGTMTPINIVEGIKITMPENDFVAPKGKQFKCWAVETPDGTQVNAGSDYTFTKATKIYAIWEDETAKPALRDINLNEKQSDGSYYIEGIDNPVSTGDDATEWVGSKIYYGNNLFRVLDCNNDSNGNEGAAFLYSDGIIEKKTYDDHFSEWATSNIRSYLNGTDNIGDESTLLGKLFTSMEKNAIKVTMIESLCSTCEDKLFLLSDDEATNTEYGFGSIQTRANDSRVSCWLRSNNDSHNDFHYIDYNGRVHTDGASDANEFGLCPAFNLDWDSVFFTTAADYSKSSFAVVGYDNTDSNIWKLTLKDTDEAFTAELPEYGRAGNQISVNVTNAGSGLATYNQTSAMLVDDNGKVVAYGSIGDASTGAKTFTIPTSVPYGVYTLKVFPEQVNDENKTDYVGNIVSQSIKIGTIYDVKVINPSDSHISVSEAADNGLETQTEIYRGDSITPVVYTVDEGFIFPSDYSVEAVNGIKVTRDSNTQITVSGTPTDDTEITLIAAKTEYHIIDGADSTWNKDKDGNLVIRGDGEFSDFVEVKVDGNVIDSSNYTVASGSTIITLKKTYLDTLSEGQHTFEIAWNDGVAITTFDIETEPEDTTPEDTTPEDTTPADTTPADTTPADTTPADDINAGGALLILPWILVVTALGFGICYVVKLRKRKEETR